VNTQTVPSSSAKLNALVTVLVVDDESQAREICLNVVEDAGLRARTASTTEEALAAMDESPVDIVITDLQVPRMGGIELLRHIRQVSPHVAVMVLTQYGTIETAIEATRLGAELLLKRRDRLPPNAVARLETIAELAVRLRETIRRLSDCWESGRGSAPLI